MFNVVVFLHALKVIFKGTIVKDKLDGDRRAFLIKVNLAICLSILSRFFQSQKKVKDCSQKKE